MSLDSPIRLIKGIGPRKAELLKSLGIHTLKDALYHFPRSYVDRSALNDIASALPEQRVTVRGIVESVRSAPAYGPASKSPMKILFSDGTGKAQAVFFNARFLRGVFRPGLVYYFHGVLRKEGRILSILHPEFCREEEWERFSSLSPVYSLTEGLTQTDLRNLITAILGLRLPLHGALPDSRFTEMGLMPTAEAIRHIHQPRTLAEAEEARRSFAFEELYLIQLALFLIKRDAAVAEKRHRYAEPAMLENLFSALPFEMTEGQKTVLADIVKDMRSPVLMNRLVQGDVGSGKTVLALAAVYLAAVSDHQAAVMVPTELLARQHHRFFASQLEPLGISVGLLVSGDKGRPKALEGIGSGSVQVAIGTHALIQEAVCFKDLTLVVTDEQHRFGVRQRSLLAQKSSDHPDILFMSATPIPRTLSLILYGDVEVSYLKEMPKGRIPIKTHYIKESKREDMFRFIEEQLEAGQQAYIVCPLVADSEEVDALSAEAHYAALKAGAFKNWPIGLIHGKMKPQEKEETMKAFVCGELSLLVSTTVIEVGVDVPAATVMVIEDSDRFGLAQLHQLRGRVGRGDRQSWCFLMSKSPGEVARERIKTLTDTTDGFVIAQKDLELRGPGEILGTRQHGLPELKAANLLMDWDLVEKAQEQALRTSQAQALSPEETAFMNRFLADFSM